jgi:hypothetical protein
MITKEQVNAAIDQSGVERYRLLCWRHPDIRTRAGFQAMMIQHARGHDVLQQHPPIELLRATPAGQKIPADESPLIQPVCCGGACKPPGAIQWLETDAE